MLKEKNKNIGIHIFTFLWPFAGLIYSVFNWRRPHTKNIIWIFCIFFGVVFMFFNEGIDSYRYVAELENTAKLSFSDIISSFYQENGILDLYVPLVSLFLSRITTNGHILFAVYATVFGYFYSRNISYVFAHIRKRNSLYIVLLLIFYVLVNPIWNINIVRFFTAAHIFVYGLMPYIYENKKTKLIWIFITVFIHWSFIFAVIIFIIWRFIPKNIHVFLIIYLITLFINTLNLNLIDLQSLGFLGDRIGLYANEGAIETYGKGMEQLAWHVKLSNITTDIIIQLYIFIMYFVLRNQFLRFSPFIRLYTFSLLLYGISNLLQSFNFPEAYRFVTLSLMFLLPIIIFSISHISNKSLRQALAIISIPIIFSIIFKLRTGMDYFGISLFFGNFITASFVEDITPLISFIKNMF
jgi:hypothetical protein